jgi:hypothetical protein
LIPALAGLSVILAALPFGKRIIAAHCAHLARTAQMSAKLLRIVNGTTESLGAFMARAEHSLMRLPLYLKTRDSLEELSETARVGRRNITLATRDRIGRFGTTVETTLNHGLSAIYVIADNASRLLWSRRADELWATVKDQEAELEKTLK